MRRLPTALALTAVLLACACLCVQGCKGGNAPTEVKSTVLDITSPKGTAEFAVQPPTRDPNEIARRMVATFQAHPTLFVSQSADIVTNLTSVRQYHQVSTMEFRKDPLAVVLKVQDPAHGTHELWAGDKQVVHYMGQNQFTRDEVRAERVIEDPTVADYVKAIGLRAWGVLSPVDLLTAPGEPPGLANLRLKGEDVRGGRPCHVVTATVEPEMARAFATRMFAARLPLARANVTMWIDQETFVLRRTSIELEWRGETRTSDEHVIRNPMRSADTNWVMVAAPRFEDAQLRFVPPKGSVQLRSR